MPDLWRACAGDIVLARSVQNPKQIVCKRVLGLEGDEVKVHQSTQLGPSRNVKVLCHLFLLALPLPVACADAATGVKVAGQHSHLQAGSLCGIWFGCTMQVPPGHVWLQGDNTLNSTDSRHYGPVPYALLRGRAFLKVTVQCCSILYKP